MKTIFLHGLGQSAQSWQEVVSRLDGPASAADCPELFRWAEPDDCTYPRLLAGLERYCQAIDEPFRLCGLSLGAVLALDYTIRHPDSPSSLVLAGAQYKIPTRLIDLQNLLFRLMPKRAFEGMGVSKQDFIRLAHSMRTLDLSRGLHRVTCPVTLVCGEKDTANLPRAGRAAAPGAPASDPRRGARGQHLRPRSPSRSSPFLPITHAKRSRMPKRPGPFRLVYDLFFFFPDSLHSCTSTAIP